MVFFIAAGFYALGAVVYALIASGERQGWAEMPSGYQPQYDDNVSEVSREIE